MSKDASQLLDNFTEKYSDIIKEATTVSIIYGTDSLQYQNVKEKLRKTIESEYKGSNMYEAFDLMHKQDGIPQGRK